MADIASWSPIDDNNNAPPPHGWPEGQMPSTANNCARAMMGGVRRWYDTVTAQIASLTASLGNYLPLGGGHLTGPVTSASSFAASGNLSGWDITAGSTVTAGFIHSTGNVQADNAVTTPYVHAGAAGVLSDGNINGGNIGASGNLNASGSGNFGGTINATALYVDGLRVVDEDGTNVRIYDRGGTATLFLQANDSYYDNNTHHFRNSASGPTFTVDGAGNGNFAGNIGTAGTITGGYIHSTGHVDADGYMYAPDGFWAHDAAGGTTYRMYSSGGASYLQFANLYAFQWSAASGALNYIASGDIQWVMRPGDFLTYNALAPVGGLGAYINMSDRRGKIDIVPSTRGLDEILRLSPVEFQRVSRVSGQTGMDRRELGFIAQDVQGVLPEAVRVVGMTLPDGTGGLEDAEPTLGLADAAVVAVLVNAVKELNARLVTLEHRGDAA